MIKIFWNQNFFIFWWRQHFLSKKPFFMIFADVSNFFQFFEIFSILLINTNFWSKFEVSSTFLVEVIQILIFMTSSKWRKIRGFSSIFRGIRNLYHLPEQDYDAPMYTLKLSPKNNTLIWKKFMLNGINGFTAPYGCWGRV